MVQTNQTYSKIFGIQQIKNNQTNIGMCVQVSLPYRCAQYLNHTPCSVWLSWFVEYQTFWIIWHLLNHMRTHVMFVCVQRFLSVWSLYRFICDQKFKHFWIHSTMNIINTYWLVGNQSMDRFKIKMINMRYYSNIKQIKHVWWQRPHIQKTKDLWTWVCSGKLMQRKLNRLYVPFALHIFVSGMICVEIAT